jgi:M6 family metalloprotease-like protein
MTTRRPIRHAGALLVLLAGLVAGALGAPGTAAAAAAACRPQLAPGSEGPIDRGVHLPARGAIRAVMLFVDFPDAAGTETPLALYDALVPQAVDYYRAVSYGRVALSVTPVDRWYRMPYAAATHDPTTYEGQRAAIAAATSAADADVDFSAYDIVYIVNASTPALPISPTFTVGPGAGVGADGVEIRQAVTFGQDVRTASPGYGAHVLAHETGHIFGLPDLYDFTGVSDYYDGVRFAGGWDVMSWVTPGGELLAWHRHLLGFLPAGSLACARRGTSTTATLAPLERPGGVKAIVAKLGPRIAVVVEHRAALGFDAGLCDHGVLVTVVRSRAPRPVAVDAVRPGSVRSEVERCGPLYDAPLDVGETLRTTGVVVRVLARTANGGLRVRVTSPALR